MRRKSTPDSAAQPVLPESLNSAARERFLRAESLWLRRLYTRWLVPLVSDPRRRQRLKLLYFGCAYWRLLFLTTFRFTDRLRLLFRFLRVDWNVLHGHLPSEIVHVAAALSKRPARSGEVMVEAGCWQGGSSAKFSILCKMLGLRLCIYDSFQGVEVLSAEEQAREWQYGGQYASPKHRLVEHLSAYGEYKVCSIHQGWFAETLVSRPVAFPVRLAFIDCDLAKGTFEVLKGVVPSLVPDGRVFSQDFHIEPVRCLLLNAATWRELGCDPPTITPLGVHLASMRFNRTMRRWGAL